MASRQDPVDLVVHLHYETASAWLVSDDGEKANAVWLPKSQCEFPEGEPAIGEDVTITVPVWLAQEKELI